MPLTQPANQQNTRICNQHEIQVHMPAPTAEAANHGYSIEDIDKRLQVLEVKLNETNHIKGLKQQLKSLEQRMNSNKKANAELEINNKNLQATKELIKNKKFELKAMLDEQHSAKMNCIETFRSQLKTIQEHIYKLELENGALEEGKSKQKSKQDDLKSKLSKLEEQEQTLLVNRSRLLNHQSELELKKNLNQYQMLTLGSVLNFIEGCNIKIKQLPIHVNEPQLNSLNGQLLNSLTNFLTPVNHESLLNHLSKTEHAINTILLKLVAENPSKKLYSMIAITIVNFIYLVIIREICNRIIMPKHNNELLAVFEYYSFYNEVFSTIGGFPKNTVGSITVQGQEIAFGTGKSGGIITNETFKQAANKLLSSRNLPNFDKLFFFNHNQNNFEINQNIYSKAIENRFYILSASIVFMTVSSIIFRNSYPYKVTLANKITKNHWEMFKQSVLKNQSLSESIVETQKKFPSVKTKGMVNKKGDTDLTRLHELKKNLAEENKTIQADLNAIADTISSLAGELGLITSQVAETRNESASVNRDLIDLSTKLRSNIDKIHSLEADLQKFSKLISKNQQEINDPVILKMDADIGDLEQRAQDISAKSWKIIFERGELDPENIENMIEATQTELNDLVGTLNDAENEACKRLFLMSDHIIEATALNRVLNKHIGISHQELQNRIEHGVFSNALGQTVFGSTHKASSFTSLLGLEYAILKCYLDAQNKVEQMIFPIRLDIGYNIGMVTDSDSTEHATKEATTAVYKFGSVIDPNTKTNAMQIVHLFCE